MLPQNQVAIIDDNRVYVFNSRNECISEEGLSPKYTTGMQKLPVISVLIANGFTDVALFHDDVVDHVRNPKDGNVCVQSLFMNKGFIRMVQKDGKFENKIRYNQMIFIYPSTFNVMSCLDKIR